jgi:hypothetical protein
MVDLALTGGIPLVCGILAALSISTRAWRPGSAREGRAAAARSRR